MADIIPFSETIPQAAEPIFTDLGLALGWAPEQVQECTGCLAARWLPWLKTIATPQGNKVLVPFFGAVAILCQRCDDSELSKAILGGFADAMWRSMADATPSDVFQAIVVAARTASSPGEINCLFDAVDMVRST